MGRNKGICTLCGQGGPLSFEHVPPEGGLNVRGVMMHTFDDWMQRDRLDGPLPNGMPQPEGTGLPALCERCNRFLGREYVPAHNHLVKMGLRVLSELEPRVEEFDGRLVTTVVSLRLDDVDRLACAKQIVSMVLVTSGRDVVNANPLLEEFVRTPQASPLPALYRLFLAVALGPAARTTGLFVRGTVAERDHDHKQFRRELRFNGESYGWEAQYLEGGELLFSHGLFSTRAAAVQWAEHMRPTVEKGGE